MSIMLFDFDSLTEKINQLVDMTLLLRRENAELRTRNAELVNEHKIMSDRMEQARERVTVLIGSLPNAEKLEEEGAE